MLLKDILIEASYPGDIGAMEMFKFYQLATDDQKETFQSLLDRKDYPTAWEMVQKVAGVRLQSHPPPEAA